jgi:hypothetical protein
MSLRDDVNAGLAALVDGTERQLLLDEEGACEIPIAIPPSIKKLAGGRLMVRINISRTGNFFTLLAPIAVASGDLPAAVLETLLGDQFFVDRTWAASFAFNAETGVVFASYHWMLSSISSAELRELFDKFCVAAFLLLERMAVIAGGVKGISTIEDRAIG